VRAFLLLAVLGLAACTPFGEATQPHRYFVLQPELAPGLELDLAVGGATSAGFYENDSIVYSRAPGTRGYYQRNSWTEVPARRIAEVIRQRSSGKGPRVDLQLLEMYHDASSEPGRVRVSVAAEIDGKRRRTFTAEAPAASFDAAGAVKGFNAAVGKLIGEIAAWAAE
jgi:cholesterol transport system auxiliary component